MLAVVEVQTSTHNAMYQYTYNSWAVYAVRRVLVINQTLRRQRGSWYGSSEIFSTPGATCLSILQTPFHIHTLHGGAVLW